MAAAFTVRYTGLTELRRALQQFDKESDKALSAEMLKVATGIAQSIRGDMPRQSGWAASTVKPHVRLAGASISIGTGAMDDYVPFLDFGGSVGRGHKRGRNMGAIHRAYFKTGRYLYPQILAARQKTINAIDEALRQVFVKTGFRTSGHL